jgi:hypothetical protein
MYARFNDLINKRLNDPTKTIHREKAMKLKILLLTFVAVFLMYGSAMATTTIISDDYWGADDHGYGDVIGSKFLFQIFDATVALSGTMLSVDIHTNFAGRGGDGLFSGYTDQNMGIGYGDLFLSSSWNPYGSAPYQDDDNSNGTIWEYGFALDDRWNDSGGTGMLYSLNSGNNDLDALLTEDFITGATFRNGQEVAVDTINGDVSLIRTGTWSINEGDKIINFLIDIDGTSLLNGPEIAFHWGQTCANDTIEGSAPVPEPATMLLFGSGLIVLAAIGRKFQKK